eukprot:TRINITY_DN33972_c0_g1_i1.p1 TRINITY_DN33972_c0_g1~~TRINITY_DN33972_c0_g1_i1.p1  ORF type:complete len:651 (+),score=116.35 TRINITY_DN33972_c0_g1_i1:115-2067(+)
MQDLHRFAVRVGRQPQQSERGRCVFADQDFSAGDVLLAEVPAAAVLRGNEWSRRCASCFQEYDKLQACTGCGLEKYCSKGCQKRQWKLQHKVECGRLSRLQKMGLAGVDFTDAVLALRTLRSFGSELANPETRSVASNEAGGGDGDSTPAPLVPCLRDVYSMVSPGIQPRCGARPGNNDNVDHYEANEGGESDVRCKRVAEALVRVCRDDGAVPKVTSLSETLSLLLRFEPGTFHIHDADCRSFAYGLFPHAALTNHSCSPNAVATFALPTSPVAKSTSGSLSSATPATVVLQLRALQPIGRGEELVHSYVDLLLPAWNRQQRLQYGYAFVCQCPRCFGPRDQDVQLCGTADGRKLLFDDSPAEASATTAERATMAMVAEVREMFMKIDALEFAAPDGQRDDDLARAADIERRAASDLANATEKAAVIGKLRTALELRSKHMHRFHLTLIDKRRQAAEAASAVEQWKFAIECLKEVYALREAVLPRLHPQRSVALARLGIVQKKLAEANLKAASGGVGSCDSGGNSSDDTGDEAQEADEGNTPERRKHRYRNRQRRHMATAIATLRQAAVAFGELYGPRVSAIAPFVTRLHGVLAEAEAVAATIDIAIKKADAGKPIVKDLPSPVLPSPSGKCGSNICDGADVRYLDGLD